ncbi:MAG: ArnT family glycosyltransferase [Burkholderiales bacterium]
MVTLSPRQCFWGVLAATLAFRLWLAGALPMTPDEAYFVLWGRHPALGYYDHPPMVGWLLTPFAAISEAAWWVRLPSVLLPAMLAFLVRGALAGPLRRDGDAEGLADLAGIAVLLLPANVWNVLITTDTPLALFSVASMLAFARKRFFVAGVLLGLAFLSKYFAVLLGLGYLAWALAARRPRAIVLVLAGAVPFGLVNLWWNWQNCWCNVMFNAINRNEDAALGWVNPVLYLLSLAYLAGPLLWIAVRERRAIRASLVRGEASALFAAWLVPFLIFAAVSIGKRVGLHWMLSFLPALVLTVALAAGRPALGSALRWLAPIAVLHGLFALSLWMIPIETWKAPIERWAKPGTYEKLKRDWVMLSDPHAVLDPLGPQLVRYRLTTFNYAMAAELSYDTARRVPVFGTGSSHARQDDIATDWRRFDGEDLMILLREPPDLERYRPFFHAVEAMAVPARGTLHYAVLGRGFDYAAYRERVLREIDERWYRIPSWLPRGRCFFFERYGFG